jgi:hypothetical protein
MFQKLLGKPKVTSYDNNTSTIPLTNDQKMRIFNDTKVMYENSKLKLALTLPCTLFLSSYVLVMMTY